MPRADVVVVTYNSRDRIRACVEPLCGREDISVTVVDNNSPDRTLEAIADLPLRAVQRDDNLGFAFACNVGSAGGTSPTVVFLNPDTEARPEAILALAALLEAEPRIGAAAPLILDEQGGLHLSQRRFATPATELSAAFFVPRLWSTTPWSVDVAAQAAYRRPSSPDWVSGACVAVRRPVLDEIGGFDERFFMYCEDMDLCRRVRDAGYDVRFDPTVSIAHVGGASAPRDGLIPVMTESRILYAAKHGGRAGELSQRAIGALHALTHFLLTTQGPNARRGYLRALRIALSDELAELGRDATGLPRRLPSPGQA